MANNNAKRLHFMTTIWNPLSPYHNAPHLLYPTFSFTFFQVLSFRYCFFSTLHFYSVFVCVCCLPFTTTMRIKARKKNLNKKLNFTYHLTNVYTSWISLITESQILSMNAKFLKLSEKWQWLFSLSRSISIYLLLLFEHWIWI